MELLLLLMIHSHIQCSICFLSWILRSICQTSHTLCMPLFLMVRNPLTSRMFAQPNQVLPVFCHLPYLIPCASAAPPLFLALILRASLNILNITLFPPLILLPQRIIYQYIPMILLILLYVISWIIQMLDQPMESLHSHSLIL